MGNGTLMPQQLTPVSVQGLGNATSVATGYLHACALTSDVKIECWGENGFGQLGDGTTTLRASPVNVVGLNGDNPFAIAAGQAHSCLLATFLDAPMTGLQGHAKCWGRNEHGQLGDGSGTDQHTPVAVAGGGMYTSISTGVTHTCALLPSGQVQCWGANSFGEIGDGTMDPRPTPVAVQGLSSAATAIAAGGFHTCAIVAGGQVQCWGDNSNGECGDGTAQNNRLTPVTVQGLNGVTAITAGVTDTCALLSNGQVECWGAGTLGQLGDGMNADSPTPVAVQL
jgi:alpha-tubulin suppressor-like RCC1 family protein